ncbi:MAG: SAF domain-containing protein, partial [Burkholderiaceae bacterium]|nr:SAF domain-containing protein [Burkholderiaceae bacterium]
FLPRGARLWGRGQVGVRCAGGGAWSVWVPVTVRIFGPALVAARPLAAGQIATPDDVRTEEVEWTREPGPLAVQLAQLQDRVLARPVGVGQPIAHAALRAPTVV